MNTDLCQIAQIVLQTDVSKLQEPTSDAAEAVPKIPSKKWTNRESRILNEVIQQLSPHKWTVISNRFNTLAHDGKKVKSPKQCRERWFNHLDPSLQKGNWSLEDDIHILETQMIHGNCWSKIAKELPGRNENIVKNRWNTLLKKYSKENDGSSDLNSLLEQKRKLLEQQQSRIMPIPFPVVPQLFQSEYFPAYGTVRSSNPGTSEGSTGNSSSSSGEEKDSQSGSHQIIKPGQVVYDISWATDTNTQDKNSSYGIFFPLKDQQAVQAFQEYLGNMSRANFKYTDPQEWEGDVQPKFTQEI